VDAEHREEFVGSIVMALRRWGMVMPAILLLEAHKPFSFVMSQALLVAEPILGFVVGSNRSRQFAALLENGEDVEFLLQRLESNR